MTLNVKLEIRRSCFVKYLLTKGHYLMKQFKSHNVNMKEFWRKMGKIGVGSERQHYIPMKVKLDYGQISSENDEVLKKGCLISISCLIKIMIVM